MSQAGPSSNGTLANGMSAVPVSTKRKRSSRKQARVAPIAFDAADEAGEYSADAILSLPACALTPPTMQVGAVVNAVLNKHVAWFEA